jgi:general secretion pathway protein D
MIKHRSAPSSLIPLLPIAALLLAGCNHRVDNTSWDSDLTREALDGTGAQRKFVPEPVVPVISGAAPAASAGKGTTEQIIRGSQRFIAHGPSKPVAGNGQDPSADIVLNFTDQPIEAVINSVLGDLLQENYSIAQGVSGSVSFSTSKPVTKQQALGILETLLGWTNNAMIRQGSRYLIVPAAQAVAGKLVPEMPMATPGAGLSARLFPLRYISATEMQKLLKPFARENAFLLVDPARNVLSMSGTAEELANYQDTVDTFDVDWLKGMSIGVYGLQRASVAELMPQLQELFGPESGTPLAGMVRFLPVERTNSIVAISSQPAYLTEVGQWIRTIDEGGGNDPQMYVYDVLNMKATDLARYLRQIYGNGQIADEAAARVAPGLRTARQSSLGSGGSMTGSAVGRLQGGGAGQGLGGSVADFNQAEASEGEAFGEESSNDAEATSVPAGDAQGAGRSIDQDTRITAQRSSNQLLVRTRPAQWKEIEAAIKRLDNPPMQVQIETRILEVQLTDDLDRGVQWYLGRLAGNSTVPATANTPGSQGALGGGGAGLGPADSFFYSFVSTNLQIAIRALETSGRTQVLSAPSLVVMNNQPAQIQVGDNVPISQTTVNTTNSDTTLSSVEYVQTGVILDVVPRINPGGLVYMDIQQQVSDAVLSSITATQANPRISTRSVATQVAVQSGQTVLLGGLIQQNNAETGSSVPYLGRIPGLRWLFGTESRSKARTELIVLITPRVVTGGAAARQVTDDYRQQMRLLKSGADRDAL